VVYTGGASRGGGLERYVLPPLFENVCPNLYTNSEGGGELSIFLGDSTLQKVSNSSPSRQREIASPPIRNSTFSGGSEDLRSLPAKLSRTALVKVRFLCTPLPPTVKHLALSLSIPHSLSRLDADPRNFLTTQFLHMAQKRTYAHTHRFPTFFNRIIDLSSPCLGRCGS